MQKYGTTACLPHQVDPVMLRRMFDEEDQASLRYTEGVVLQHDVPTCMNPLNYGYRRLVITEEVSPFPSTIQPFTNTTTLSQAVYILPLAVPPSHNSQTKLKRTPPPVFYFCDVKRLYRTTELERGGKNANTFISDRFAITSQAITVELIGSSDLLHMWTFEENTQV